MTARRRRAQQRRHRAHRLGAQRGGRAEGVRARGCSRSSWRSTAGRVTGFGCDGIVCATPTGSTAYAFSAGGPVVWPEVEALLMVPISAHALFAKPLVTSPDSVLAVEVLPHIPHGRAVVRRAADGRAARRAPGSRSGGARCRCGSPGCTTRSFTDRLVAKFALPVAGLARRAALARREPVTRPRGTGASRTGPRRPRMVVSVLEEMRITVARSHRRRRRRAVARLHRGHRRDRRGQDHGRHQPRAAARRARRPRAGADRRREAPSSRGGSRVPAGDARRRAGRGGRGANSTTARC